MNLKTFSKTMHSYANTLNKSKFFAALVMLMMNFGSRYIDVKFSKSQETYLKNTLGKPILIFAISWMGTRDVFVALFMTCLFAFVMGMLLNEESPFCCFSEGFTTEHLALLEEDGDGDPDTITKQEMESAMKTLEKAQKLMKSTESSEKHNQFLNVATF